MGSDLKQKAKVSSRDKLSVDVPTLPFAGLGPAGMGNMGIYILGSPGFFENWGKCYGFSRGSSQGSKIGVFMFETLEACSLDFPQGPACLERFRNWL